MQSGNPDKRSLPLAYSNSGPTTPSSRMVPVDKCPATGAAPGTPDRSEFLHLAGVGNTGKSSGIPQESLETIVLLQVASPSTCLPPFS
ncbi:hypothetical protein Tco_0759160 [Tanacetum coccineum]